MAGGEHRGRFLPHRKTVGFGGGGGDGGAAAAGVGEGVGSFPTKGQGHNPGAATARYLEGKSILVRHKDL